MTRESFVENITSFYDLIEWCYDNDCYVCEGVHDCESYDECINDEMQDLVANEDWECVRDYLNGLPTGDDYYYRDDYGDWRGLTDSDFDELFDECLDWGDDNGIWEDDEEEPAPYDEEYYKEQEDDEPIVEMGMSFDELFSSCNGTVQRINKDNAEARAKKEADEAEGFNEFVVGIAAMVGGSV